MASIEQEQREAMYREIGATIAQIESAVSRCRRARDTVGDAEPNVRLALERAAEGLERARQELQQSTYFGGSQQRLV
jgi:predicted component of type VI protein secretion system